MQAYLIVAVVVAVLAVIFAFQNNAPVAVAFFSWRFEGSLALVVLVAFGAGAVASFLASLPALLRTKWHLSRHRKRLAELEAARGPAAGKGGGQAPGIKP